MRLILSYFAIACFRAAVAIGSLGEAALNAAEARRAGTGMLPAERLLMAFLVALPAAALWIMWIRL